MQNIHPLFVHFPLALLAAGLFFDFLGVALKKDSLKNAGWWCQAFGMLAIMAAAGTGLMAEESLEHSGHSALAHETMEQHEMFMLISAGVFAMLFVWRAVSRTRLPEKLPLMVLYFAIGAVAAGTMFYGAHQGGRLVYEFGIGGSAVKQPAGDVHQGHDDGHQHDKASESEEHHEH